MKKMVLIIMAACMIAALMVATVQADVWYICNCKLTGNTGGTTYVVLDDTASPAAFTNRWFTLDPSSAKQQLAVALTAISTGYKLNVSFSGSSTPPSGAQVSGFYVDTRK